VNDHHSRTDRIRLARFLLLRARSPLRERPLPSPARFPILDDALLGSDWRWDGDDERSPSAR
jgi:hypothetical protein